MVWTDVAFKTLTNFAVGDDGNALNNPLMIEALLHGHVATQVLAIRRLVDDGNSDIISLRRLVKDMRRNFALFTRENYVCFDGLPYDYEAVRHTRFMENAGNWGKGGIWVPTSGPQGDCISESAHRQFDQLAGIDPAKRSREGAERPNSRPAGDARSRNGTVQNSSRPCENSGCSTSRPSMSPPISKG
jgi:hypothetical protein